MATPARKPRARRPFATVESPSPARNGVLSENIEPDGMSFAQRLHQFKRFSGESKPVAPFTVGRAVKKYSSPVSKRPTSRSPRTARRRRIDSSRKSSTPAVAAYDAPRAPLWDFSEECQKVRAKLSSPYDEAEHSQERRRGNGVREASRKRTMRSVTLEEAMASLPEPGEGRVKFLVNTFERLLSLSGDSEAQIRGARRRRRKVAKTDSSSSLPSKTEEIDMSYPSISSSSEVSCNVDFSDHNSRSSSARDEWQQRRCISIDSLERSYSRKMRSLTSQHPFNLRTEQRGRVKDDNFLQRMRKRLLEEERLRNPLAQGLPWTTDEPENPVKPPTKEPTQPMDVVLHSSVRAVGRAKFDHQVAERNCFLEKLEMEKERQRKMDEEIEIKQLRKEQVPIAHPMPDFSRPFVPKRSVKPQTIPREPRFHPRLMRHTPKTKLASYKDSSSSFCTREQ